jgi:hypothetical protein
LKSVICEGKHVPVMCPKVEKVSETQVEPVVESSLSNVNCSHVKTIRPIGIMSFQTITTRLYGSLLGSCDL